MIDAFRAAIEGIAKVALKSVDTHALYEGTVVKQVGDLLEVNLDDQRFGKGITHLPIATGIPGATMTVPKGTRVAVGFHDWKRDKPYVRHFLSGTPLTLSFDATTTITLGNDATAMFAARIGDTIQAGPFPGVITSASTKVKIGN